MVGETYNIGRSSEKTNLEIVRTVCAILGDLRPRDPVMPHGKLIAFVQDRPVHDRRYAVDIIKIRRELGWLLEQTFETGIRNTLNWYLADEDWICEVTSGSYRQWISAHYSNVKKAL